MCHVTLTHVISDLDVTSGFSLNALEEMLQQSRSAQATQKEGEWLLMLLEGG